jgi:hypothetical protein
VTDARSLRIEDLAKDTPELIDRLVFALEHRYAHNIVTMSVETAEAILLAIENAMPLGDE